MHTPRCNIEPYRIIVAPRERDQQSSTALGIPVGVVSRSQCLVVDFFAGWSAGCVRVDYTSGNPSVFDTGIVGDFASVMLSNPGPARIVFSEDVHVRLLNQNSVSFAGQPLLSACRWWIEDINDFSVVPR